MHRRLVTVLMVALLATAGVPALGGTVAAQDDAGTATCSYPFTATDATGTEVTVSDEPERVVVVGASGTQTMWEIGAQDKVVGIWKSPSTTYLDGAANVTGVATQFGYANVEEVLAQNPDLVLLANIQKNSTAEKLRQNGTTVFKFHAASSIQDVYEKTRLTGKLVGNCEGAEETVTWMQNQVQKVQAATANVEDESMLYPMSASYSPGANTFITDIMRTAGAHNVVLDGDFGGGYVQLSGEFVVQQNPEWLLASYTPALVNGTPSGTEALESVATDALKQTQAYQNGNIVVVNSNYLSQPAPRLVYPLLNITKALHPDAWAAVNATTTTTTTSASGTTTTTTTAATTTSAEGSTPGFGVLAALAALAGALVVARRR
ncbi:PGF-CTERM-anchored ABC transporter substrate-binding protein [Salarchaeum sp. JOR-1]|uniref:PGF-CTERM-anchored ABC transporter substrate-binding protein n=1 Tax=Salarchaeum sp. JOR-1 TaxID=2599399 RepID=UPI0011988CA9|nr:PGF-CTERM-anchored ABC transporter substrate-binding protein [Salarchaeum sp. JOR-1]QDX41086.1 ABC transporter substrate-binding protein [Salarchaeum sp. JOR-1]